MLGIERAIDAGEFLLRHRGVAVFLGEAARCEVAGGDERQVVQGADAERDARKVGDGDAVALLLLGEVGADGAELDELDGHRAPPAALSPASSFSISAPVRTEIFVPPSSSSSRARGSTRSTLARSLSAAASLSMRSVSRTITSPSSHLYLRRRYSRSSIGLSSCSERAAGVADTD